MLNCYWPKHLIGTDEVQVNGYNMGLFLMIAGMSEISDKTIDELRFRKLLLAELHNDPFYLSVDLNLWKGLQTNVSTVARRTWLSNKKKGRVAEATWHAPTLDKKTAIEKLELAKFKAAVAKCEAQHLSEIVQILTQGANDA